MLNQCRALPARLVIQRAMCLTFALAACLHAQTGSAFSEQHLAPDGDAVRSMLPCPAFPGNSTNDYEYTVFGALGKTGAPKRSGLMVCSVGRNGSPASGVAEREPP